VRYWRPLGNETGPAGTGRASDRVGERAALRRHQQVSCTDAGRSKLTGEDTQHHIVAWMPITRGQAVGQEGRGARIARDEPLTLDANVVAVRKAGVGDELACALRPGRRNCGPRRRV
jgi:hypothetical protein